MRRGIAFIAAAAILIAVAWWVSELRGLVSITIGDTTFEARAPVAIGCFVVLVIVIYVLIRLLVLLLTAPRWMGQWRRRQRRLSGDRAITRTLLALASGDNTDARRAARRARRLLGDTPQTLLLTAEAARARGDEAEAEGAYRTLTEREEAPFLGYRGLLRQSMERKDWVAASRYARLAEAAHPGAAWLRGERRQLAVLTGNWTDALALTDAETPKAALATAAANAEPDPQVARRLAKQAWTEAPGSPAAALAYARRLRETGHERRAQSVIRRAWAASPQPDLAGFALSRTAAGEPRVQAVRRLIAANPDHVESRLLLARTLLDAGQAAEAKQQIDAVREAGTNQRRVWALTADIDEALGNETGAREALRHVSQAEPDPEWFCENCGAPSLGWAAVCPTCGEMGRIAWGRARRHEVLPPPPAAAQTAATAAPEEALPAAPGTADASEIAVPVPETTAEKAA